MSLVKSESSYKGCFYAYVCFGWCECDNPSSKCYVKDPNDYKKKCP